MTKYTEKILEAFAASSTRWRTARSIAKETKIPIAEVTKVLERSPEIIKARKGSRQGEALFARKEKQFVDSPSVELPNPPVPEEQNQRIQLTFLILLLFDASATRLRDTIGRIVRQEQGRPVFLEEIKSGAVWVDEVSRLIRASDAVIADVTRQNPNVMFELGMAHGLGKPLVLLLSEVANSNLPTDLLGYQYLTYAPDDLSVFAARLSRTVRQLAQHRGGF